MNDYFVYLISDRTGVPVYVGKGRGKRDQLSRRRNAKINALIAFGGTLPPVKVRECLTETEAYAAESALIAFHGRADLGQGTLLNLCDGGAGVSNLAAEARAKISTALRGHLPSPQCRAALSAATKGKPLSPETRAKMSAARLGKPKSAEHRAAISEATKGKPKSPEAIAKTAAAKIGKKHSPETRAKMSAAHAARWARRHLSNQEITQ